MRRSGKFLPAMAALVLGFGVLSSTPVVHAKVTGSVIIPCEDVAASIDGDLGDVTSAADYNNACDGLSPAEVAGLAAALGDADGILEASDFASIDVDGNQVMEGGALVAPLGVYNKTYVIAFVNNDGAVTFDAGVGLVMSGLTVGGPNPEICVDAVGNDLDCSTATVDDDDGVIVATATIGTAAAGSSVDVTISQADDPVTTSVQTINVVGRPHNVALSALKSTVQVSGTSSDFTGCKDALDITNAAAQLADSDKTVLAAEVTDTDGTKITRAAVSFSSASPTTADWDTNDNIEIASGPKSTTSESVTAGASGVAALALLCGGTSTGTATITATIVVTDVNSDVVVFDTSSVTLTVVGSPSVGGIAERPDMAALSVKTPRHPDSAAHAGFFGLLALFVVVAVVGLYVRQASTRTD